MFEGYTPDARQLLVTALEEARALRSDAIGTGHLLLGVTHTLALLVPLQADDVRARLGTGDAGEGAGLPFDVERALREGGAVPVWLGDRELPIGDLGHPRVDARLLLAILGTEGRSAELLREHGLDEAVVRAALGGP